jgi:hypothetical protein
MASARIATFEVLYGLLSAEGFAIIPPPQHLSNLPFALAKAMWRSTFLVVRTTELII